MKPTPQIPEGVASTLATFEKMVREDEQRLHVLEAELSALRLRERVIGATQNVSWLVTQYILPREHELGTLQARLRILRGKLQEVRERWLTAPPVAPASITAPAMVWLEADSPDSLSLSV